MNLMKSHRPHLGRRKFGVAALVLALLLTTTTVVFSQATDNFDLGCRAILASGGGSLTHGATGSVGVLGQFAPGTTVGSVVGVRSGYIQPIPASQVASRAALPTVAEQSNNLFMPILSKVARIARQCQY